PPCATSDPGRPARDRPEVGHDPTDLPRAGVRARPRGAAVGPRLPRRPRLEALRTTSAPPPEENQRKLDSRGSPPGGRTSSRSPSITATTSEGQLVQGVAHHSKDRPPLGTPLHARGADAPTMPLSEGGTNGGQRRPTGRALEPAY